MTNYNNILLDTDSYKVSMWRQYPPGTEFVSSYVEARKNPWTKVTFFGLQHILKELAQPVTRDDVEFANRYWTAQGLPFNLEGWLRIVEKHNGKLPLKIQAVPEGTRLTHGNVLVQVINTDPEFFWLTTWVETKLMRVWYPTTVATLSATIRDEILAALEQSADAPDLELPFKLHDFGARGVSSVESASIGGAAHLINFNGTDTGPALFHAMKYYGAAMEGTCGSIPAAEHSTITSWGRENERDAYANMITQFGSGGLVAVVSDSYDVYNTVSNIWGDELKAQVEAMAATLVVRPDSGDPTTVPVTVIKLLDEKFGSTINSKGYKVLNHVRVIQGDGINLNSIKELMKNIMEAGYSISNIAFGMGGALLQAPGRDDLGFAMKCSAAQINGVWKDVYKDPVTDHGKRSKRGRLALVREGQELKTVPESMLFSHLDARCNVLETVFENGVVLSNPNWADVVGRARS